MRRRRQLEQFITGPTGRTAHRELTPEARIKREILEALSRLGVPVYGLGAGAFRLGERFIRIGTPGIPDLLALPKNRGAMFIEVKSLRGRLSRPQVLFRDDCRHAGAVHVVARSLEDVLAVLGVG